MDCSRFYKVLIYGLYHELEVIHRSVLRVIQILYLNKS